MTKVDLYNITPNELAKIIKEGLKPEIIELIQEISETRKDKNVFLTRDDTCEFLKISKVTLHDWVKKKILIPYKMGNRTYFCRAEIVQTLRNSNRREKA